MEIHIDKSKLNNKQKVDLVKLDIISSEQKLNDIIKKYLNFFQNCKFKGDNRHHNLSMIFQTLIFTKFQREKFLEELQKNGQTIEKYVYRIRRK